MILDDLNRGWHQQEIFVILRRIAANGIAPFVHGCQQIPFLLGGGRSEEASAASGTFEFKFSAKQQDVCPTFSDRRVRAARLFVSKIKNAPIISGAF